jgi:hypothetical protein
MGQHVQTCMAGLTANLGCSIAPKGLKNLAQGFNPISANLIKASTGRMYFVPEGQADRSQARSAWNHEENSPVPAGRLNGSRAKLGRQHTFQVEYQSFLKRHELHFERQISLTTTSPVPPGRGLSTSLPRHFVPAYDQPVPPGQKPFAIEGPRIKSALMELEPWAESSCPPRNEETSKKGLSSCH